MQMSSSLECIGCIPYIVRFLVSSQGAERRGNTPTALSTRLKEYHKIDSVDSSEQKIDASTTCVWFRWVNFWTAAWSCY